MIQGNAPCRVQALYCYLLHDLASLYSINWYRASHTRYIYIDVLNNHYANNTGKPVNLVIPAVTPNNKPKNSFIQNKYSKTSSYLGICISCLLEYMSLSFPILL